MRKNFESTKTQIKPKPTNKTKTTKATIFRAKKLLGGRKAFVLRFGQKQTWNCLDNLIYNTTQAKHNDKECLDKSTEYTSRGVAAYN